MTVQPGAAAWPRLDAPVEPAPDDARDLLIQELSGADYRAASPTLFDRIVRQLLDWLEQLGSGGDPGGWVLPAIALLVVVGLLVAAVLLFGRPRRGARTRIRGQVFGEGDARDAAQLRRSAARAAADGDWSIAIIERFRALARALEQRTVVAVTPGSTAQGIARNASAVFTELAPLLADAADRFDRVRYLGDDGDEAGYLAVAAADDAVSAATPSFAAAPFAAAPFGGGA